MKAFLLDEAAHGEDVWAVGALAEVVEVGAVGGRGRGVYTVENQVGICATVFGGDDVGDDGGDDDDAVGELCAKAFAGTEHPFGELAPLLAVVVGTVVGHDYFHAQHAGEGGENCRTYGVDVEDVRVELPRFDYSEEGVDDGFEALLAWGIHVYELDAAVLGDAVVAGDVGSAADDGHVMAERRNARVEFFAMSFDPTEDVGDAASADYHNFHTLFLFITKIVGFYCVVGLEMGKSVGVGITKNDKFE